MPRTWHVPGLPPGTPPKAGRPSKGDREEFTIRLPREIAGKIRRWAAEEGISINELFTRLFERYFARARNP